MCKYIFKSIIYIITKLINKSFHITPDDVFLLRTIRIYHNVHGLRSRFWGANIFRYALSSYWTVVCDSHMNAFACVCVCVFPYGCVCVLDHKIFTHIFQIATRLLSHCQKHCVDTQYLYVWYVYIVASSFRREFIFHEKYFTCVWRLLTCNFILALSIRAWE